MSKVKILAFSGSSREESYNKMLVKQAVIAAEKLDAEVTYIDSKDYRFALYDGDIEQIEGMPEKAKELRKMMIDSDAFIISTPEYNGALSGLLKNMIDWCSRNEEGKGDLTAFKGKIALIMSASPGRYGGTKGLLVLRYILSKIGTNVLPTEISFGEAQKNFDDKGNIINEYFQKSVPKAVEELVETANKLR